MKFPNLSWAIANRHLAHYEIAALAGMSEARLSRGLKGRKPFSALEQQKLAMCLGYEEAWLFQELVPPPSSRETRG